jgi:hypothetical protein
MKLHIFAYKADINRFAALATLLFFSLQVFAQPKSNSPYSRYGLGDLSNPYLIQHTSMGGVSCAYSDPLHLNANNPAALSALDLTAYEGGLFVKRSKYQSANQKASATGGNLSYLALGFTLHNVVNATLEKTKPKYRIGMGLFLEPVSTIGYDIRTTDSVSSDQIIVNQFQGDGGFYRFKYGVGVKKKHTSAGAFLGWQFGKATYENTSLFDTLPAYQNNFRDELRMHGFVYSVGVQHEVILARLENNKEIPTRWLTFGLTANGTKEIGINATEIKIRSRGRNANGSAYIDPDTLVFIEGSEKRLTLPASVTFGVMYTKLNKLRIGADFGYSAWSKYNNDLRPDTLQNALSISGGIEYTPDHSSYNSYIKRVRYRFGAYYRQDPRVVNREQVTDLGITLGFGLPLVLPRQQTSAIHLALELGQIGSGTPIKENYFRISAAYTLNDNSWFYKRRFE